MLEAYTWNQYFSTLAFGLAAYYLSIGILYYPKGIRDLVSGKTILGKGTLLQKMEQNLGKSEVKQPDSFEELETLVAQLKGILERAGNKTEKTLLLQQINQILSNHPGLREPAYRVAIINFLSENLTKWTGHTLSEEDLSSLWLE